MEKLFRHGCRRLHPLQVCTKGGEEKTELWFAEGSRVTNTVLLLNTYMRKALLFADESECSPRNRDTETDGWTARLTKTD